MHHAVTFRVAQSLTHAAVFLLCIALLPIFIGLYGKYDASRSGCIVNDDIGKTVVQCEYLGDEKRIQRLLDINAYIFVTFLFAGVPGLVLSVLALSAHVRIAMHSHARKL